MRTSTTSVGSGPCVTPTLCRADCCLGLVARAYFGEGVPLHAGLLLLHAGLPLLHAGLFPCAIQYQAPFCRHVTV